jgi:ribose transport system permease protein
MAWPASLQLRNMGKVTRSSLIVVGGTSLAGGNGSPLNTLIGTLIVVVLGNGMVLLGVPPYVQQGIQGVLIIVAVTLALNRSHRRIVK